MTSLQRKVTENYLQTTSHSNESLHQDLAKATLGVKRGLGDWLNVQGKKVVDLGCGTGELCWLALSAGASSVTGVNLSAEEIELAKKTIKADFQLADILDYLKKCEANSVDTIFAFNIFEHLSKDHLYETMTEAHRALKPQGELIVMVPNATSPFGAMTRYWDITHQLSFTPSSARQLQKIVGFKNTFFKEWGPRPYGFISTIRFVLWQLIRLSIMFRLLVETASTKDKVYTADMLIKFQK